MSVDCGLDHTAAEKVHNPQLRLGFELTAHVAAVRSHR
jgi:hypothetical protein